MLKLIFKSPYKSISGNDEEVSIHNFTILTGANGSGKTHLLEAIRHRHIVVTNNDKEVTNIELLSVSDLLQHDNKNSTNNLASLLHTRAEELIMQRQGTSINEGGYIRLVNERRPLQNIDQQYYNHLLVILLKKSWANGKAFLSMQEVNEALPDDYIDRAFKTNSFSSSLSDVFKNYQLQFEQNEFNEFKSKKGQQAQYLKPDEFKSKFGPPPWEVLDTLLKRLKLPYKFNKPVDGRTFFHAKLQSTTNSELSIELNHLSSGEQILLSILVGLYRSKSNRSFPQLLLLDEPDAHLHPSMSSTLVDMLSKDILPLVGAGIILTTHSPSTCAFAKTDQLYKMNKDTKNPQATNFKDAISELTFGLPVNITRTVTKQICVEDTFDAEIYTGLWNILRPIIDRKNKFAQLNFVPASKQKTAGGCSEAVALSKKLRQAGVETSFSLIDYDMKNSSTESDLVLGEKLGYSIENFTLNPLLVSCLILHREGSNASKTLDALEGVSFANISSNRITKLQAISNEVIGKLLTEIKSTKRKYDKINLEKTDLKQLELLNRKKLNIPVWFLESQGHQIEELILETFPSLKKYGKNNKNISIDVVRYVASSHHNFIPMVIKDSFENILHFK